MACQTDDASQIEGYFQAVQSGFSIPTNPPPAVAILGRASETIDLTLTSAQTTGAQIGFQMDGLPLGQTLIFEISGTQIDPIVTFPVDATLNVLHQIPILAPGTVTAFINQASNIPGANIQINPAQGLLGGLLRSNPGTSQSPGIAPGQTASVRLKDRSTSSIVGGTQQGPFYFDTMGNLVQSSGCVDPECSVLYVNIPEGSFVLEKLDVTGQVIKQIEVLVFASRLTFGIDA